jgi:hypothetical protein
MLSDVLLLYHVERIFPEITALFLTSPDIIDAIATFRSTIMKSSNKWLLGFGSALGILVILAIILVLTMPGSDEVELLPESTPEGVVQRYVIAIKNQDYGEAYGYLSASAIADEGRYNSFEEWSRMFLNRDRGDPWRAVIGEAEYFDNKAFVDVTIEIFSPEGLFGDPVREMYYPFTLEQEGGVWKITSPLDVKITY